MQQLLGTAAPGQQGSQNDEFGAMLGKMLNPTASSANLTSPETAAEKTKSDAAVWRIIHVLFSLTLAIYVAVFASAFDGTVNQRSSGLLPNPSYRSFWTLFAATEVVLQSGRYVMERGELPRIGFLGRIAAFLPQPYASYISVLGRYGVIASTVFTDAMVVVFTLGIVSLFKGVERDIN